jgi:hypothetical protein
MFEYFELLQIAGIDPKGLDALEIMQISGRIIHDPLIRQRKAAMVSGTGNGVLPDDADEQIIKSMPDAERAALRKRVRS